MRESFYLTKNKTLSPSEKRLLKKEIQEKWTKLLLDEIKDVEPQYILSLGSPAWESFRDNLLDDKSVSKKPVTQVHGLRFEIGDTGIMYVPLAFFPGTSQYLRDSYFEYFESGINPIKEMT
jgi:hypothetical protein